MNIFYVVILFVVGILAAFKPELMWKIDHFLSVKEGEPTDFYLGVSRFIGIVFVIVSVVCFFIFITH